MNPRLTIAGRINLFLLTLAIIVSLGAGSYLLYKEYHLHRDAAVEKVLAVANQGVEHQLALYYRDPVAMNELLTRFLALPGMQYAAIFDPEGNELLAKYGSGILSYPYTNFLYLRKGVGDLDQKLIDHRPSLGNEQFLDLSMPIFARVNPVGDYLDRNAYGEIIATLGNQGSQFVIGYYHFGISQTWLLESLYPFAQQLGLIGCGFLLLVALLTLIMTRRITAPLASLAQMAEDIAAGKLDREFRTKGSGEVRQIASMLNIVMAELNKYKSKMDTDHHLLSMKVEERTVQLSKRNEELNQAVKQVTKSKNRLRQLAYYDSLTALPNRQLFTEQLELLLRIALRENRIIALLFIDLDNFKRINDSLGHAAGDVLLKEVAARLSSCVRNSDLLAQYVDADAKIGVSRLGGDEFTVVLNGIDVPETAGLIAGRVLESLQAPMIINDHEVVITPSIGIALAPTDAQSVEQLLKLADVAMYHAKSSGRNTYRFYTSTMKSSGVGRLKLETDLRKAVDREELELYYQPQVDTITGKIIGAEALVRWNHPTHGLVPPVNFIPLAEEMGLIVELGAWTLEEACRQSKLWMDWRLDLPKVAVNVSSLQFNASFTDLIKKVLSDAGLPAEKLELELTEGVIMSNARASTDALVELKELGCSLSVDDFGTGYSSLSYLSKFPLDELKIDRSFVIEYDQSPRSTSLISAIIAMGKSLNLTLVAEGVDDPGQYQFLREQQVDIIQGYLFSKPIPADEFTVLLKNNHCPDQIEEMMVTSAVDNG